MHYNLALDLCIFNAYVNVIKDIPYDLPGILSGSTDPNQYS